MHAHREMELDLEKIINLFANLHPIFLSYVSTDTGCSISLYGFYIFSQYELIGPHHFTH